LLEGFVAEDEAGYDEEDVYHWAATVQDSKKGELEGRGMNLVLIAVDCVVIYPIGLCIPSHVRLHIMTETYEQRSHSSQAIEI
jgi:hypothetical protein